MTREELLSDLAYARSLAEEGRHAPLLGGAYLMFWGVLNAVAFIAHWAVLERYLPTAEGAAFVAVWGGYGLAAAVGMFMLGRRACEKPGLTTIGVRAEAAMWRGVSFALGAVAIGSIVRMLLEQDPTAPNAILGAGFALYGAALFGTARLSQQSWITAFAALSFLTAGVLCVIANQNWAYLIAALASLLVLVAPGIVLIRREPSAVV